MDGQNVRLSTQLYALSKRAFSGICCLKILLQKVLFSTLKGFCADAGYRKTCKEFVEGILEKVFEISERITDEWAVIPKR